MARHGGGTEVAFVTGAGQHRAICQHAFVQYGGNDACGCGYNDDLYDEDGHPAGRCGFYRQFHPTMVPS